MLHIALYHKDAQVFSSDLLPAGSHPSVVMQPPCNVCCQLPSGNLLRALLVVLLLGFACLFLRPTLQFALYVSEQDAKAAIQAHELQDAGQIVPHAGAGDAPAPGPAVPALPAAGPRAVVANQLLGVSSVPMAALAAGGVLPAAGSLMQPGLGAFGQLVGGGLHFTPAQVGRCIGPLQQPCLVLVFQHCWHFLGSWYLSCKVIMSATTRIVFVGIRCHALASKQRPSNVVCRPSSSITRTS